MTIQPSLILPHSQSRLRARHPRTRHSPDDVSENEFLQLLVAQIQYQDPTNPTDSTAFVTQLAQFSSLEQLIAIHSDLDDLTQCRAGTRLTYDINQGGY